MGDAVRDFDQCLVLGSPLRVRRTIEATPEPNELALGEEPGQRRSSDPQSCKVARPEDATRMGGA